MKLLPLYNTLPQARVAQELPREPDSECDLCDLSRSCKTVCMRAEASAQEFSDALLLVAEAPGRVEDNCGRPFSGQSGAYLRRLVKEWWGGAVILTNACACAPGVQELKEKHVEACRGHLARVITKAKPKRIVALGAWAAFALLGRKLPVTQIRRAHSFWIDEEKWPDPAAWNPIYVTVNPAAALRNRFVQRQFEQDLKYALQGPIPTPRFIESATAPLDWSVATRLVENESDALDAAEEVLAAGGATLDTETSGAMFTADFRVDTITLVPTGTVRAWTWDRSLTRNAKAWSVLKHILADESLRWCAHNSIYDVKALLLDPVLNAQLHHYGDTRLYRKLLDGDVTAKLEIAAELVGMGGHKAEAYEAIAGIKRDLVKLANEDTRAPLKSGKARTQVKTEALEANGYERDDVPPLALDALRSGAAVPDEYAYRWLNPTVRVRYNARDAVSTELLRQDLEPALARDEALTRAWNAVMRDAQRAVVRMEMRGCLIDRAANETFSRWLDMRLDEVARRLAPYFPGATQREDLARSLNSPKQLRELLFGQLKLPATKKTKTDADSTDKDVLRDLRGKHPIIADIEAWRSAQYQQAHYAEGLRAFVKPDGRIHTHFLLAGTDTGRLSSSDPNLFNATSPERDPVQGKMTRDQFVVPRGYVLIECDQGQVELRTAARLSQDARMLALFNSGEDFHLATARVISKHTDGLTLEAFNALSSDKQKLIRRKAKTCIAAGELVLTSRGLVPIEAVDKRDLVWDGTEWVAHTGVVYQGYRKVITYDGLTATPDHVVWLSDGSRVELETAAIEQRKLAIGGNASVPVGYTGADRTCTPIRGAQRTACGVRLFGVRTNVSDIPVEYPSRQDVELSVPAQCQVPRLASRTARRPVRRDVLTLHESAQSVVHKLWCARYRMPVFVARSICALGAGELAARNVYGRGYRSYQQRWALRAWKPASRIVQSQSAQQANQSMGSVPWVARADLARLALGEAGSPGVSVRPGLHATTFTPGNHARRASADAAYRWARVYDITNAGPRHRFTVSGRIVSNCNFGILYGKVAATLAEDLACSKAEAQRVIDAVLGVFPDLAQWMRRVERDAKLEGGVRVSIDGEPGNWRNLLALGENGDDADGRRAHAERAITNTHCQGTAAHITTSALWPMQDAFDGEGLDAHLILTVYDSVMVECAEKDERDALQIIKWAMTRNKEFGVPNVVDFRRGLAWGSLETVKV